MNNDVEEGILEDVVVDNGISIFQKIGGDMTNNVIEYIDEWTMLTTIRLLSNDWNRFVMQQRPTKIWGVCSLMNGLRGSFFDMLERRRRDFFADAMELTLPWHYFGDITFDEVKDCLPGLEKIRHRTWIPVDGTIISVTAGTLSYAVVEVYKHSKRCSPNQAVVLWKDYGSVAVVDRESIHPFVDPPLPRLHQNRWATNFLRYYLYNSNSVTRNLANWIFSRNQYVLRDFLDRRNVPRIAWELLGVFLCLYTLALNGVNIPKEGEVIHKMEITVY